MPIRFLEKNCSIFKLEKVTGILKAVFRETSIVLIIHGNKTRFESLVAGVPVFLHSGDSFSTCFTNIIGITRVTGYLVD